MAKSVSPAARTDEPGQSTVAPLTAIRGRAQKVSNLWIFDSPKNNRRVTVSGDVAFLHLILLEGDADVVGYDFIDDPFKITSNSSKGYVRLRHLDRKDTWLTLGRHRPRDSAGASAGQDEDSLESKAKEAGVTLIHRTELELSDRATLIDNWITLCAIMTRARSYPSHIERDRFLSCMTKHGSPRVVDLLAEPGIDPAMMLAVIAKALQSGRYVADLDRATFGLHTHIRRGLQ
jgi:hypothetical protein